MNLPPHAWHELQGEAPRTFAAAREDAHWAFQVLSAVGYTHLEQAKDDSQSNAGWIEDIQVLAGRSLEVEPACFASLSPEHLTLQLHEPGGELIERFECKGGSLDDAYSWLELAISRRRGDPPLPLKRPEYEMPVHALADGACFGGNHESAYQELARWMHDANLMMRELHAANPGSTEPRVWPHHFDMGMLLYPETSRGARGDFSIGVGLSPGDDSCSEPYWYVNPYPSPESDLPRVSLGSWHREGWIGLTLRASEILQSTNSAAQESLTRDFLGEAVAICRELLLGRL